VTYASISGRITLNGVALPNVSVCTAPCVAGWNVYTAADGRYTIPDLPAGTWKIVPTLSPYVFSPANRSVAVNGIDVTGVSFTANADFKFSPPPASVRVGPGGSKTTTITTAGFNEFNSPIYLSVYGLPPGATATFSQNPIAAPGSGSSTLTLTAGVSTPVGAYLVSVYGNGGSKFHTTQVSFLVNYASISGTITFNGVGLANVNVCTAPCVAGWSVYTAANGRYTIPDLPAGTWRIVPTLSTYVFTPANRNVAVNGTDVSGANFTATKQ